MKIAISAMEPDIEAQVDPRFGRCQYFVIIDPETLEFEAIDNPGMMAGGGAGIATAQMIANKGVQAVLTGNCGPNAFQTLSAAGVQLITGVGGPIRDAIDNFKAGALQAAAQPNVEAHFGTGNLKVSGGGDTGKGGRISSENPQTTNYEQEVQALRDQVQILNQKIGDLQNRITNLENRNI